MVTKATWFKTEASLCKAFIDAACKDGKWAAYPETEGWDIVLSRKSDGLQVGVQAKLALNAKVLTQALPHWTGYAELGPDCRAVLVPAGATGGLETVCDRLGITVLRQHRTDRSWMSSPFHPALPEPADDGYWWSRSWHPWLPVTRLKLPDYVPDVVAGASAPSTLSHWKIQAIKLAIVLEERPVHRGDFKALALSPSRWTDRYTGWLTATPAGYVANGSMPDFAKQHPVNYAQIKADKEKWGRDMRAAIPQGQLELATSNSKP